MTLLSASLEYSFLLFPLILGTYLSYRILKLTDMTIDGSFILGAALFARLTIEGISPLLCLLGAAAGGGLTGLGVAFIQKDNKIPPLVASILGLFILYSVNFQIMGRPNIGLMGYTTPLETLLHFHPPVGWILFFLSMVGISLGLRRLLQSPWGLFLKTFGENRRLIEKLGRNPESYRRFGLSLSNSLSALSGAFIAQVNGYADLNMGLGVALTSIGAVVIGKQLLSRFLPLFSPSRSLFLTGEIVACFVGIFVYSLSLNLFLWAGVDPIHLKLILGLLLIFFLKNA